MYFILICLCFHLFFIGHNLHSDITYPIRLQNFLAVFAVSVFLTQVSDCK